MAPPELLGHLAGRGRKVSKGRPGRAGTGSVPRTALSQEPAARGGEGCPAGGRPLPRPDGNPEGSWGQLGAAGFGPGRGESQTPSSTPPGRPEGGLPVPPCLRCQLAHRAGRGPVGGDGGMAWGQKGAASSSGSEDGALPREEAARGLAGPLGSRGGPRKGSYCAGLALPGVTGTLAPSGHAAPGAPSLVFSF